MELAVEQYLELSCYLNIQFILTTLLIFLNIGGQWSYGVATISRLLKIIGLICKRAL